MSEIISKPFEWNDSLSEIAQEDFSMIQKSLSYGTATSIGMALAKLELLEKQGCNVMAESVVHMSALDKIKIEIDAQINLHDAPFEIDDGIDASYCNGLNKAKQIIDKYTSER